MMADCKYRVVVDETKCIGCSMCVETCPNEVLESRDGQPEAVRQDACEGCEVCMAVCEQEAIKIEKTPD
jgi:Pyruvate/2-oxoacid:ferredoxin oxidoreductase delta subunit